MISPSLGSILFQKSSINRTPGKISNIFGYIGPNGIPEDVPERARTVISVVQISDSDDEPVTRGMPYNFAVLKVQ